MYSVDTLIQIALNEDIGPGDITTDNLIDDTMTGYGVLVAKESFVISGIKVASRVFKLIDPQTEVQEVVSDGDFIRKGDEVLRLRGKLRTLLHGERTALNFLQRLSGIATNTSDYVKEIEEFEVKLVDTRKTLPGWRRLEKKAVRDGGALNHRFSLFDGVLIKDNHIAVAGGINKAVSKLRTTVSHLVKIEVEVSNRAELEEAVESGADVIMLDNMELDEIKKSVDFVDKRAIVEVSGSVVKSRLKDLAKTGVDIISSGALTHQAQSVDISMKINL